MVNSSIYSTVSTSYFIVLFHQLASEPASQGDFFRVSHEPASQQQRRHEIELIELMD